VKEAAPPSARRLDVELTDQEKSSCSAESGVPVGPLMKKCGLLLVGSGYMSREIIDRIIIHGLRGLDHRHMPGVGNGSRVRILHQTRYSIHPQWRRCLVHRRLNRSRVYFTLSRSSTPSPSVVEGQTGIRSIEKQQNRLTDLWLRLADVDEYS